jgi:hypothetical protein
MHDNQLIDKLLFEESSCLPLWGRWLSEAKSDEVCDFGTKSHRRKAISLELPDGNALLLHKSANLIRHLR